MHIRHFDNLQEASQACLDTILDQAKQAISQQGRFIWSLAGGSTPAELYNLATTLPVGHELDWSKVFFLFGDERCVPPDHPQSNLRMVKKAMFDLLPIKAEQVLAMDPTLSPASAALDYEKRLHLLLDKGECSNNTIDCALLGMGPDGHTVSLFPQSPALQEEKRWVLAVPPPTTATPKVERLTMTIPLLSSCKSVLILAGGPDKRKIIQEIASSPQGSTYPITRLAHLPATTWFTY